MGQDNLVHLEHNHELRPDSSMLINTHREITIEKRVGGWMAKSLPIREYLPCFLPADTGNARTLAEKLALHKLEKLPSEEAHEGL